MGRDMTFARFSEVAGFQISTSKARASTDERQRVLNFPLVGVPNSRFLCTGDGLMEIAKGDIKAGDQLCVLRRYHAVRASSRRDGQSLASDWNCFVYPIPFNDPTYWETV